MFQSNSQISAGYFIYYMNERERDNFEKNSCERESFQNNS